MQAPSQLHGNPFAALAEDEEAVAETGMRLLFLDVDGVICFDGNVLEPAKLRLIQHICHHADAKVVLSTDWRRYPDRKQQVLDALAHVEVECVGAPPTAPNRLFPRRRPWTHLHWGCLGGGAGLPPLR